MLTLNRDGSTTEEYSGPGQEPWNAAGALQNNGQRPLNITRLRALMANTDPAQRIQELPPGDAVVSSSNMTLGNVENILNKMVDRCAVLVSQERRGDLLNERFFHHMFHGRLRGGMASVGLAYGIS